MIGAKDLAFPRLNLLSWYIYMLAAVWMLVAILAGGIDTGWTFYTPYSSQSSNYNVFIDDDRRRDRGLFVDADRHEFHRHHPLAAGAGNELVPAADLRLDVVRHQFHFPAGRARVGHGAVAGGVRAGFAYRHLRSGAGRRSAAVSAPVLVLFAPGRLHHDPAGHGHRQRGHSLLRPQRTVRLQVRRYGHVWHRVAGVLRVGAPHVRGRHFDLCGTCLFLAQLPGGRAVGDQGLQLDGHALQGSITFEAPMLFRLGFVVLFTFGGMAGLFLATLGIDMHVHDTYFVIAHFHFIMVGGMVSAYMAGLHYWWPKITGRMYSEWWSRLTAIIICVGFFLTFLPQYVLGYNGMPRRYHTLCAGIPGLERALHRRLVDSGRRLLAAAVLLAIRASARAAGRAESLECNRTGMANPSPPPRENFAETPVVVRGPYKYPEGKAQNEP